MSRAANSFVFSPLKKCKFTIFSCQIEPPSAEQEVKVTSAKKGKVTCAQIMWVFFLIPALHYGSDVPDFLLSSCKEEN